MKYLDYQPFGETKVEEGTFNARKKFTGKELDEETGLYDYAARMYDAKLGRFISADTIEPKLENPQSLNRYSYCLNNPLKYIDPSGHYTIIVASVIAYINTVLSSPDLETDLQQMSMDAAVGDYASVAMDAVGVAVPGLSAAAVKGAAKVANAVGRGIRLLNKVGKRGNIISKATKASGKAITVIGSLKDTAKFKGKQGFNVLEEVLEKQGKQYSEALNKSWLDESIARGDEIWVVTNPKRHQALAKDKGFISEFIKTEIPHLEKKTGVSVLDKFK